MWRFSHKGFETEKIEHVSCMLCGAGSHCTTVGSLPPLHYDAVSTDVFPFVSASSTRAIISVIDEK